MNRQDSARSHTVVVARIVVSLLIVGALVATLTDRSGLVPSNMVDLLSYYTLQTNVAALAVWTTATVAARGLTAPPWWLELGRAFVAANLVLIAGVYWLQVAPLGLQDGPQLVAVMIVSHVVTPIYVVLEHLWVGDRAPLPVQALPWLIAYPALWSIAAVLRAWSGGWVPYEYMQPSRGIAAVAWTIVVQGAVLTALTLAAMRLRRWRRLAEPAYREYGPRMSIDPLPSEASQRPFSRAANSDITPKTPKSSI